MKVNYNSVKLERDDFNTLQGVIGEALDNWELTDEELNEYWEKLPNDIKADAMKWGLSDTPVIDNIYLWILNNAC